MASNVFKTRQKITHVSISTYIIRPCNSPHGNPLIRDFLLEPINTLNFSLNVSRGVHRRKAIFVFLPPIVKTDSGTKANRKRRHFHAVVRNLTCWSLRRGATAWSPPCAPFGRWFLRSPGFSTALLPDLGLTIRLVVRSVPAHCFPGSTDEFFPRLHEAT